MPSISEATSQTPEASARAVFARQVQAALARKYWHFLPRFPDAVQAVIVGNMLGRASRWRIDEPRALLAFCEFMIAVAPNFDEQPEIRAALERQEGVRDQIVSALPRLVPRQAWAEAERDAARLPLYAGPRLAGRPDGEQTAAAVPLVLHDRPEAADAAAAVAAARPLAERLQLAGVADGLLLATACRSFYGDAFASGRLPWSAQIFGLGLAPRMAVNALRFRLALDFARFV